MLFCTIPARAQTDGPASPYVDRLIGGTPSRPEPIDARGAAGDPRGKPRTLTVEFSGLNISPSTHIDGAPAGTLDPDQREIGFVISGRYQTDNFGLVGIDGGLRRGSNMRPFGADAGRNNVSGMIRLSDRDFPIGQGWLADAAIGTAQASAIPLLTGQPRFYIPVTPLLGATVTVRHQEPLAVNGPAGNIAPDSSFNVSVGRPGLLGGLQFADFVSLSGMMASAGGQMRMSPTIELGAQAISFSGTRDPYAALFGSAGQAAPETRLSGEAALLSASLIKGGLRVQVNGIWSHLADNLADPQAAPSPIARGQSAGGWLDASFRAGRIRHTGGLYYFGPDLSWGTSSIVNNVYGGYYRLSAHSQRWQWYIGLDAARSVRRSGASGVTANADLRRQLTFRTSMGLSATFRRLNGQTYSQTSAYLDHASALGTTRAEISWSQGGGTTFLQVAGTQNWSLPAWAPSGTRLSTQLTFEHRRQENAAGSDGGNGFGISVSAAANPLRGITVDGTASFSSNASRAYPGVYGATDPLLLAVGQETQRGLAFSASLSATARLSSRWVLSATLTDSRTDLRLRYGLPLANQSPLGTTPGQILDGQHSTFRLRAAYLSLRYAISAGRPALAIGRQSYAQGGTGTLAGSVCLDADGNGRCDAREERVSGILIIIDGLHAIRTDAAGVYRLDGVAEGPHRISVIADTLPLPWAFRPQSAGAARDGYYADIEIEARGHATLDIPAGR